MEELLAIGEFSSRCGLSPKMLRTYAAAGLLRPAAVDRFSGYRYYAPSQVEEARLIGLLRRAGVPLAQITGFISAPTAGQLEEWEAALEAEFDARRQALAELRKRLNVEVASSTQPPTHTKRARGGQTMMHLTAGAVSETGPVRATNQDAVVADGRLFAVADGMGRAGGVASRLALQALQETFGADPTGKGLSNACREANRAVWRSAEAEPELSGMGTTIAALGLVSGDGPDHLAIVHVGDSRAYLLRQGRLERLTADHSVVADRVRSGEITEQEARLDPQRSLLTRALGIGPDVEADTGEVAAAVGDRFLLCTDGLVNELDEAEIAEVLSSFGEPANAAGELVGRAVAHGGHDNTSAVVVDVAAGGCP